MVDPHDPRNLMSFSGKRLLDPDEVAAAGIALLHSNRILATVPRRRGFTVPLLGLAPGLSVRPKPMIERRARRNRAADRDLASFRGRTRVCQPGS